MHPLRNALCLGRLVLAWFALSLLTAAATPMVLPAGTDWVCSGGVMKLVAKGDAGQAPSPQMPDCPLCLAQDAPPPAAMVAAHFSQPLGHAVQSLPAARIPALTAAPFPARGPPG